MTERTQDTRQPSFTFPKVRGFTGKIQYRVDDMESINSPFGVVKRGEVKEVLSKGTAENLVENGDFSHVAADTPVGVPQSVIDAHSPKRKTAAPEPAKSESKTAGSGIDPTQGSGTSGSTGTHTGLEGEGDGAPSIVPKEGDKPATAD